MGIEDEDIQLGTPSKPQANELRKFLTSLNMDKMTVEQKVDTLKRLPFEKFLEILIKIHGKALNVDSVSVETWKAVRGVVRTFGIVIDYESPPEPVECLRQVYEDVQKSISHDSYKDYAAKLYSAILFAHMFSDGNGRLARGTYLLLTQPEISEELNTQVFGGKSQVLGYDNPRKYGATLAIEGIARVLKNHGLKFNDVDELATINAASDEGKISLKIIDGKTSRQPLLGNMAFLKFLAAKEILNEIGVLIEFTDKINLEMFSGEGLKQYEQRYDSLRRELFFEIQKLHDEQPKNLSKLLESTVFNH